MKRAAAVVGLAALLFVCEQVASYFVLPLTNLRVAAQNERLQIEGQIETLVLGASLTGDGVDTAMMERETGEMTFNMATNGQSLRLSYYALMDVAGENPLKTCLIEVSLRRLSRDVEGEAGLGRIAFSDFLTNRDSRLLYMRENYTINDLPRIWFNSARCQLNFFTDTLMERFSPTYLAQYLRDGYATASSSTAEYTGRGFIAHKGRVKLGNMSALPSGVNDLDDVKGDLGKDSLYELQRAVALCRERGITPILFSVPLPDARILEYQDCYQELTNIIQRAAHEMGVSFYDFNYSKALRAQLDDTHYKDQIHMNQYGAEVFTPVLMNAVQHGVPSDAFYGSFEEMLGAIDRVGGVMALPTNQSGHALQAIGLAPEGNEVEYRFLIAPKGSKKEDYVVAQQYSLSARFPLSGYAPGAYSVRIEAREASHPERAFDAYTQVHVQIQQ